MSSLRPLTCSSSGSSSCTPPCIPKVLLTLSEAGLVMAGHRCAKTGRVVGARPICFVYTFSRGVAKTVPLKDLIGIDHAVVVVDNLDGAAATWKRFGFTISPRGTHSAKMGTGNHTIMLGSDYIELMGVLAATELNAPTRAFLARTGGGIERIAFTTTDAAAGAATIRSRGYEPVG